MKKLLTILFLFAVIGNLSAEIAVKSFRKLENDLDARVNAPIKDFSGDISAIIKVVTNQTGFTFDCGQAGIVKTVNKPSEIWVYVPYGVKRITLMHPHLGQLRDWLFTQPIEKATVYEMVLITGKVITSVEEEITSQWLLIKTEPAKAMIYLNDQFVKTGEYQAKLKPGNYTYRVELPLYHIEAGKIEITDSKKELNVILKPAFGNLYVTTTPESGATVLIDGKEQNTTTPCQSENLASGEHSVQVIKEMYQPCIQKVVVKDGKVIPLSFILQPTFAQLNITSSPEATIYVNNQQRGNGTWNGRVNAGVYSLEARIDKHKAAKQDIELIAGDVKGVNLIPTPVYGSLDVMTTPAGATIILNSKEYGTTPTTINKLLIGDYTVQLKMTDYSSVNKMITISDGKTSLLNEILNVKYEQTAETYLERGNEKEKLKDYSGAILEFTKAINVKPDYINAYFSRGNQKFYLQDYSAAIEDYSNVIKLNSREETSYFNRGLAKAKIEDYKGAIEDFSKVIEIEPKNADAYFYRGMAKSDIEDYKAAIEDYTNAIEINPKYTLAYFNRGLAKWKFDDDKGAIENFSKVIEIEPKNADAYFKRGIAKGKIRDYKGAIEDFSKVIEIEPKNAPAFFNRGIVKVELNDSKGAVEDFTICISIDKEDLSAYVQRAISKSNLKDRVGAINDYDFVINYKGEPYYDMALVYNNKAYCLVELDENENALPLVNKALSIDQKRWFIWDTRGELYYNTGKFEESINDMNNAISLNERSDNSYYIRGLAKIKLGKKDEGYSDLIEASGLGKEIPKLPILVYGSLEVITSPAGANIKINGKDYGTTPKTINNLLIGENNLFLTKKGFSNVIKTFSINELKKKVISETLLSREKIKIEKNSEIVNDVDGNVYHTLKIGEQIWMVENLKVSQYTNGDIIPNVKDSTDWVNAKTGAWCFYNNDLENNIKYGKLYNFYAATDKRNIAPLGWHIPTYDDWRILSDYLDESKFVESNINNIPKWLNNDSIKENINSFNAILAGSRFGSGDSEFSTIGDMTYWWSSEQTSFGGAIVKCIMANYANAFVQTSRYTGASIRCIKDK